MRTPFLPLLPMVLTSLLLAVPVAAHAPPAHPSDATAAAERPADSAVTRSDLSPQTAALAELQARSQALMAQRELERVRSDARIRALENERDQLLSAAVIAILLLLLAIVSTFGLLLRKRHQQLRRISEADALTGLHNRRAATARLDALATQTGPEGTRHVLFLIDVDHFKQINDTYGHPVGDDVLVAMARRLKAACRPTDLVARWGGEEFLVACANLTREQAEQVAARLRRAMACTLETAHAARPITVSLGLAPIPFFDAAGDQSASGRWKYALRMADRALYAAKRNRDAWVGYWGARLPDEATAEAVLEQPEAAAGIVTVMSSVPRIVATSSEIARAGNLRTLRAQG